MSAMRDELHHLVDELPEYDIGFEIPVLGFNGTAQTGWDTDASIKYVWGGVSGWVCGDGSRPLTSPIVEAKA
jgi:hypothetical protein